MHEESDSDAIEGLERLAPEQEDHSARPEKDRDERSKEERGKEARAVEARAVVSLNVRQRRPRLVIDHMVLEDFKSYAGRQVVGKFHGNFTSVVGPNGSGKSNLIESMLFIFGFNASWMRLNKLNQLIHNSSSSTGNARAAVEVHFKKVQELPDGQLADLPHSHFAIRRTVNNNSQSKYFLDGRETSQAEVKERLRGEGIDLANNRFLILQGEVEQISQMRQKSGDRDKPGLLEYLEEIIGSGVFIERIEECGREYLAAEEQKHEKGQLMRLVENELKGMTKAKDEAVRFVRKEKTLFQAQNVYAQVQAAAAHAEARRQREQAAELERTRDRIVAEERERLKTQAERIREIKRNKAEQEEAGKGLEKLQEGCNKLQLDDKHLTQEIAYKSEDLVKFERKAQESDRELARIIAHCEDIRARLPAAKDALAAKTTALEPLRAQLALHEKPHLRQRIRECEVQAQRAALEAGSLRSKLEGAREAAGRARSGRGELEGKLRDYQAKAAASAEVREKIEKARAIAEKIAREKTERVGELGRQREQLRVELRQVEGEVREQLSQHEQQGQLGNMFREVMQQGFPGVLGRLGDLGEVSREHDEVITTCCSRLDNIVVADFATGEAVLNFLKTRRLGRATCIILDKIADHRHYMNRPFENLPRAVRLFDLIKFKTEEAKLAFYFALSDTLYCEDSDLGMEYAMRNDHQRRRVISKNKNRSGYVVIEMNGLMAGCAPRRGGFTPKAATNARPKADNHPRDLEARKKELGEQLEEVGRRLAKEEGELKSAAMDIEQMRRELVAVVDNIREFEEESRDLRDMLSKADRGTAASSLDREALELERQVGRAEEARAEAEGVLRGLEEEQRQGEAREVVQLRERYKAEKAETAALEKQFDHDKAILENSLKRIDELKRTKTDSERRTEASKRDIDAFKAQQVELERKVSELIAKMTAYEERLRESKKAESELRKMMEEDEKEVRDSKAKVEKARREVEAALEAHRRKAEEARASEQELEKVRKDYRELTATYSFLEELDEIEKMGVGQERAADLNSSSLLETSMLNSSLDASNPRIFQADLLVRTSPLEQLTEDQLEHFSYFKEKLFGLITAEAAELKRLEGSNLEIINEFRSKYAQYRERLREFEAVRERQGELKRIIDQLKEERLRVFREGFGVINCKLKEVYQHLTRGGDAELELIDALDPFSDGVNFSVRPPKKSWKEVNKLSGGEKTLSSLSLIFALHYYKPTPLYFMDEIDAALDFKNVAIVADYIKKRTKDAQFIIISLRNNMFDLADKLVGVYKTNDKTKVINLDPSLLLARHKENNDRGNRQEERLNRNQEEDKTRTGRSIGP